ncbi:MAG: hypothetical protein H6819_04785 [Phycisphaerales bacterium]|nr:hypothetical protein [Phycisphaerales bacterium]MCB9856516.1 hypothetical protein [Phycisphaerales bacterium]MCB9863997.1 hypothetical protein [Phycisphaerales bacterium]
MSTNGVSHRARSRTPAIVVLSLFPMVGAFGCSASRGSVEIKSQAISAPDLIERCASAYSSAETIRARGRLILQGDAESHTRLVTWDYAKPERTRLRVGERVAVIRDGEWYRYDPTRNAYRRHPGLGGDPIQTAVYFMTDGAPMPEIAMPISGAAALGAEAPSEWRLNGVRWVGQRPCYVLMHPYSADRNDLTLAIWIDQDTCLFRGWAIQKIGADVDDPPIVSCEYDSIELNAAIADDQFAIGRDRLPAIARANVSAE